MLFAAMCLIWRTTWIAVKAGAEAVPLILCAGTRLVAAGILLFGGMPISCGPSPRRCCSR